MKKETLEQIDRVIKENLGISYEEYQKLDHDEIKEIRKKYEETFKAKHPGLASIREKRQNQIEVLVGDVFVPVDKSFFKSADEVLDEMLKESEQTEQKQTIIRNLIKRIKG